MKNKSMKKYIYYIISIYKLSRLMAVVLFETKFMSEKRMKYAFLTI